MNGAKKWVAIGALFGLTAVATGAMGAHALADRLDADGLAAWKTASSYQMVHALALFAVAWVGERFKGRAVRVAGWLFVVGVVMFSGSIYGLTLGAGGWLGPVTPVGGVLLMVGWGVLAGGVLVSGGGDD